MCRNSRTCLADLNPPPEARFIDIGTGHEADLEFGLGGLLSPCHRKRVGEKEREKEAGEHSILEHFVEVSWCVMQGY